MIEDYFTHTATIYKQTETVDAGRVVTTHSESGTLKGRFNPLSVESVFTSDKRDYIITDKFYCNADEDITEGDQLEFNGKRFWVRSVINPFMMNNHYEVLLEEIL
jgi:SPP1 family predicted phage head-tail adaptor